MVKVETRSPAASNRYRWGTILVWVGVLVWLPFIFLRAAGYTPSLLWFLPFHLIGVVGGSRMRSSARKESGSTSSRKNFHRMVGHGLILAGILMWMPGLYQKLVNQTPLDVASILPFHLTGVLGGAAVLVSGAIKKKREE